MYKPEFEEDVFYICLGALDYFINRAKTQIKREKPPKSDSIHKELQVAVKAKYNFEHGAEKMLFTEFEVTHYALNIYKSDIVDALNSTASHESEVLYKAERLKINKALRFLRDMAHHFGRDIDEYITSTSEEA